MTNPPPGRLRQQLIQHLPLAVKRLHPALKHQPPAVKHQRQPPPLAAKHLHLRQARLQPRQLAPMCLLHPIRKFDG
jgi:hypothetical protein